MKYLLLTFFILMGCFNNDSDKLADKQKDQSKDIEALEQRITELKGKINQTGIKSNSEEIKSLRRELRASLNLLTTQFEAQLKAVQTQMRDMNSRIENNSATLEELSLLKNEIESQRLERVINTAEINPEDISLLAERLSALESAQAQMVETFTTAINSAQEKWEEELTVKLTESQGEISEEIRTHLQSELERIMIETQALITAKNQTKELFEGHQAIPYQVTAALERLNNQISALEARLNNLREREDLNHSTQLISDILQKEYAACYEDLAEDDYCFTQATTINRLGGQFINPMTFDRTKEDLLSYLRMSGVTLKSMLNKIDEMITPGEQNTALFNRCSPDLDHAIAIQQHWPRLVILALIFEKIENDILVKKEHNLISENIQPISYFVAWWRSQCYNDGFYNTVNKASDHVYAAALDVGFADQANQETFDYYRSFIQEYIWRNDSFGVVYPLKSANLTLRVAVGMGHGDHGKGQLHLGINSEIRARRGNNLSQWLYNYATHGDYNNWL